MEERMIKRSTLLALVLAFTTACGGKNRLISSTGVSGPYELVVTSSVTGDVTLVEANFKAQGSQSSANGPDQVQILTLEKKTWYLNGVCHGATPGENSVSTEVSDNNVALTVNEGGSAFTGQGVLTGLTITGNYAITGSTCPALIGEIGYPPGTDSGGVVGNQVPELAGTFVGTMVLPNGTDNAALTLNEATGHALAVSAKLTGPVDNGTFSFTGSAVGNVMFVSGSVNGQNLSLFGYYDRAGTFTGMPNSILVFNYSTLATAGLLIQQ
jgi:hypothetical protein